MIAICTVFPDLLGTYGDAGNGLVLEQRALRRGLDVTLVTFNQGRDLPDASIYLLGGGEDGPQRLAADLLAASAFTSRIRDGARVFAVCAGLQILGETFCVEGDDEYSGLGLVDVRTRRGLSRSVGDLVTNVGGNVLVGFENHGGVTDLGTDVSPFGLVVKGRGNGASFDGYRTEQIWATYAHGPVLAMNPWLADEILTDLTGEPLEPLQSSADRLYAERCQTLSR